MRSLYSFLIFLATPLVLLYLFFRGMRSRDYLKRWSERFAWFEAPEQVGGIVIHAASMGEVNAASMLINEVARRFPQLSVCITTLTPTGSERVRSQFGDSVFHVYAPLDLPGAVRRFLDRLRPRLLIVMETEIWPNLYHETAARDVPILIANARISPRSLRGYQRVRTLTAAALGHVSQIGAQSQQDAERLLAIGARESRLTVTGNLKFDVRLPPSLLEQGESIRLAWGTHRLVLIGGSTHEADETALLAAFVRLLPAFPNALLVLVPRHPERFGRAAQLARAAGLSVKLRSAGIDCPEGVQCLLVDAMGELMHFYAASDVAFVGGTLEPIGGHNALEPAALCKPVVVGPHTFNFDEISAQLLERGAALRVGDEEELESAVRRLFADGDLRDRMGQAGCRLVRSGQGAVDRTVDLVASLITPAID